MVRVAVDSAWKFGTTVQIYTDEGDGSVDYTAPLLHRRAEVFPNVERPGGWGKDVWGHGSWGRTKPTPPNHGGWGQQSWGHDVNGWGYGDAYVEVPVLVRQAFGYWKFGVKAYDESGNVQSGANESSQMVCGQDPPPLSTFTVNSYDDVNDQMVFDFTL